MGYQKSAFLITGKVLFLPMYPEFKQEEQKYVVEKIVEFYNIK